MAGTIAGGLRSMAHNFAEPSPESRDPAGLRHEDIRYEHSDINAPGVVITGVCVLAGAVLVSILMAFLSTALAHQRAESSAPPLPIELHGNPMPPELRLQEAPARDLKNFRVYEDSVLNRYSWVDQSKGVVGLPIERAMELIAQRGIPPQTAPAGLKLFEPRAGTRLTGFEGKVEPEPR